MNFNKFINSDYLKSNPLCGISTYKDELNLNTGACTRQIRKLVLTGDEVWGGSSRFRIGLSGQIGTIAPICTHYRGATTAAYAELADGRVTVNGGTGLTLAINDSVNQSSLTAWKTYLAQQYANGTPVTVWCVLATPTTETITVPSGLSGTEEGYLIQDGTPTPTNPIYPTANTVEKWFDTNHYIMGTDTDTITTLPADIYANDNNATVGLKGNMSQTGTPTPTTPIQPQECGERTGNLFDEVYQPHVGTAVIYKPIYVGNGEFTLSTDMIKNTQIGTLFLLAGNVSSGATTGVNNVYINNPITVTSIDGYVTIGYRKYNENTPDPEDYNVMLNTGSTALPYEPYGYKIPILSGSVTTNVYLGEVQSTRRIKKLVLDGTENWDVVGMQNIYGISVSNSPIAAYTAQICTHYTAGSSWNDVVSNDNRFGISSPRNQLVVHYNSAGSTTNFKAYLAQQYANGTPVCVWYVLATPETAVVNEPLRKIGTYTDEVSGITIPTIAGANTLSVGTTLQPSEVTVNYKGWHPVQSVHERESGQWD